MKTLLILALFSFPFLTPKADFDRSMERALERFDDAESTQALMKAAAGFDKIAEMYPEQWQPVYYAGISYASAAFAAKDRIIMNDAINKCAARANTMTAEWPQNAESHVLMSVAHGAAITANPSQAPQYTNLLRAEAQKALDLAPGNPRAQLMLIRNGMGAAQWMNQPLDSYCAKAQDAYNAFDTFKSEERYAPNWGKDELLELANSCK